MAIKNKISSKVLKENSPLNFMEGFSGVVKDVTDYLKVSEIENTKRTEIISRRDVALASIQSNREILKDLIKHTFDERAMVIKSQIDALEIALKNDNFNLASISLQSMITVVQSSPFKTIDEMSMSLRDSNFILKLN
jgi:hypothetical protein